MNEIHKLKGAYQALVQETDPMECSRNQRHRNQALNRHYFNDNTGFTHWNEVAKGSEMCLCLCGMEIINVYIVKRGNVKAFIGSSCINRYGSDELKEKFKELLRKTFDCKCGKRVKKENNQHGKCLDCDTDIDCKYNKCYPCKYGSSSSSSSKSNGGYCKDCGTQLDVNWKTQCGRCWYKSQ